MSKRLAMPNEGREVTKTPGHCVLAHFYLHHIPSFNRT